MRAFLPALVLLAACGGASSPMPTPSPTPSPMPTPSPLPTPSPTPTPTAVEATVLRDVERAEDAARAPNVASFVDAYANARPVLLSDGRVVFLSTRDGITSLYVGDPKAPGAAPRKLKTPDERVAAFDVLPDDKTIVFTSDVKSDGNFAVFRVDIDGSSLQNMTAGETLHRDPPVAARRANGVFAFSAHATSNRAARVFIGAVDGPAPRQIAEDPAGGAVVAIASDGTRVLFERFLSENEQVLFTIDVAKGRPKRVYPAEGNAKITEAAFAEDGGIYVATEQVGAPPQLHLLDAVTFAERASFVERTLVAGSIGALAVSPLGDRLAIVVDAGNRGELRFLDAKTLAVGVRPKVGPGTARAPRFSPDGKRLGIALLRPDAPMDIFAVDVNAGDTTPLRADVRPGLGAMPKIDAHIVNIKAFDGLAIPLNVYLPKIPAGKKVPTFVLVHGGPSGSAYLRWSPTIAFFVAMGFAIVEPNIRGSSGFGIEFERADDREKRGDALKDIESVNTWARAQPWCDGAKMAIGGISYGGYMTLLALTRQPTLWSAGIDGSGMSDLRTMEKNEDQTIRAYDETEFGTLGKDDAVLAEWSPLKDASKITAPVFVYQGVHDPVTPQLEADQIVQALRTRAVAVEYMLVENEGHGLTRRENLIAYLARNYRFLRTTWKIAADAP